MAQASSLRTALVLAGGGSLGAIQVGMLKALVTHGLRPDLVVGASVGALNGAYFAGDPTPDGVARLQQIWCQLRRRDVFPLSFTALAGFALRGDYLLDGSSLRNLIERNLQFREIEQASIPLHIVATDVLSGDPVVLSRGHAADAITASAAVPAAFAPIAIAGRYLCDGAITSNTPVRVAVSLGARRLIVLPTGYACALSIPPQGAIANALHALTLLIARQLVSELEALDAGIEYHIVPPLCPLDGSAYDFSRVGSWIERAELSARDWIAAGGLEKRHIPDGLRQHRH